MNMFKTYFIFVVIGVMPTAIANYQVWQWEWWAVCIPFWFGIFLRSEALK